MVLLAYFFGGLRANFVNFIQIYIIQVIRTWKKKSFTFIFYPSNTKESIFPVSDD